MVDVVKQLSENPLQSVQKGKETDSPGGPESPAKRMMLPIQKFLHVKPNAKDGGYETELLENTLTKIGALLQVCGVTLMIYILGMLM